METQQTVMERIATALRQKQSCSGSPSNSYGWSVSNGVRDSDSQPQPQPQPTSPVCPKCKGLGWYVLDVPTSDKRFGRAQRCECGAVADTGKRADYLSRIDGLTEVERAYRFDRIVVTPDNQAAYTAVIAATARGAGLVTLQGKPGRGKTYLLISAVNDARGRGVAAVYTTMTDLLDWLRQAFDPRRERDEYDLSFDRRWELLTTCKVLALDEIDEFNATAWAMERALRLFDERWRRVESALTILATNTSIGNLPEKVESRLKDARAAVIMMGGDVDFRGV